MVYNSVPGYYCEENKKFWEELIRVLSLLRKCEVLEPNEMELNLSELTLTSYSSV
jgi:hypothetical protein